jgi:predicted ribosome quality control (RQC) complex YloA/Tae2 family protein
LALLLQGGGPLWRLLVGHFAGVSPTLAREVAWRAAGDIEARADTADAATVLTTLHAFWQLPTTGQWEPGTWVVGDAPTGFASYIVHGRGPFQPLPSISQAVEQYYAARQTSTVAPPTAEQLPSTAGAEMQTGDSYAAFRSTVANQLRQAEARVQRQLTALAGDEPAPGAADELRVQAEWLLALSTQIEPNQQTLTVDLGERTLTIPLVANKTPVEQAEQLFQQAAKAARAAEIIPERRAKLQTDLEYLAQLQLDLANAANQPEIAAIQQELVTMGLLTLPKSTTPSTKQRTDGQPLRYYSVEGFEIVVGRNARQNERVTFEIANADDLWLHARGAPGAHVAIRCGGQTVRDETLQMAAQLAAYHSKLVGERAATVIVTPRRFVSRAPGGRPGQVLVRQESTLTVPAELPAAEAR